MLLLELTLAAAHLVIVIDVAALALSLGIDGSLAGMTAFCCHSAAPVLVIAVIAHSHRVKRQIYMWTGRNYTLFTPRTSICRLNYLGLTVIRGQGRLVAARSC